uniref:transketolase n=1 Tax=Timema genevievae TaxID=629358 RepID=A0A7R9JP78_TIMGE|nr:unnamed protein product [Timema genevievae]
MPQSTWDPGWLLSVTSSLYPALIRTLLSFYWATWLTLFLPFSRANGKLPSISLDKLSQQWRWLPNQGNVARTSLCPTTTHVARTVILPPTANHVAGTFSPTFFLPLPPRHQCLNRMSLGDYTSSGPQPVTLQADRPGITTSIHQSFDPEALRGTEACVGTLQGLSDAPTPHLAAIRSALEERRGKVDRNILKEQTQYDFYNEKKNTVHILCCCHWRAEQNLVGVAIGAACRDRTVPFVSTFAAFLTRSFDQIRMGAISQTNVNFCGSHCGISIGEDGPSQMGLEDIAMFRTIPGATIFYPSDAVSCERAVELAANTKGICYIRTSRPNIPVIYKNNERFEIGRAKIIERSNNDEVLVIAAGITFKEAMKARKELIENGINIRLLDPFTIKPIDKITILKNAEACKFKILTVEDHYSEGGLGEAVLSVVACDSRITVKKLAVEQLPRSGAPDELLDMFGINARGITKAIERIINIHNN